MVNHDSVLRICGRGGSGKGESSQRVADIASSDNVAARSLSTNLHPFELLIVRLNGIFSRIY